MPRRTMRHTTAQIINDTIKDLNDAELSWPLRFVSQRALATLKLLRSYEDRISSVERLEHELKEIQGILDTCSKRLREAERTAGEQDPGSEVWWNHHNQQLTLALGRGAEPGRALRIWRHTWLDGIVMKSWDGCRDWLARKDLPQEVDRQREAMAVVTADLEQGRLAQAYPVLRELRDEPDDVLWAARNGLLSTRLLLAQQADFRTLLAEVQSVGEQVEDAARSEGAAPEEIELGRALAATATAEAGLRWGDQGLAARALSGVVDLPRCPPEALVAAGRLAEQEGEFDRADRLYERALQSDRDVVVRAPLLQETPARLLIGAARTGGYSLEERVALLRRAVDEGPTGTGDDDPERELYLELGDTLTKLAAEYEGTGRSEDAQEVRTQSASPYAEAGRRFNWAGLSERAIELLKRACDLSPGTASHHWNLAEALRIQGIQADESSDVRVTAAARAELQKGLRLQPSLLEPWVLVTQGMIELALDEPGQAAVLSVERSLALALSQPGQDGTIDQYALGYGFLTQVLRRRGWLREALVAGKQGYDLDPNEPFLFRELIQVMVELGEYDEAWRWTEHQSFRSHNEEDLRASKAWILDRLGQPSEALELLDPDGTDESLRYVRARAYETSGRTEEARTELEAIWDSRTAASHGAVVGWAAFRCGHLEEAVALHETGLNRTVGDVRSIYGLGLGQLRLVQGEVDAGQQLLLDSIAACSSPDDLFETRTYELPKVRAAVEGTPHAAEAHVVIATATAAADARIDELRTQERDPSESASLAAQARTAVIEERWLDAIMAYTSLDSRGEFPEARGAIRYAAAEALHKGDRRFRAGERDEAMDWWSALRQPVSDAADAGGIDLLVWLSSRMILLQIQEGTFGVDDVKVLGSLLTTDAAALHEAADVLAFDLSHYWSLRDGLESLTDQLMEAEQARALVELIESMPLDTAYDVGHGPDVLFYASEFTSPLHLRLGEGLNSLLTEGEIVGRLSALRRRITDDMGVLVPWVEVSVDDGLDTDEVEFLVFDRSVRRAAIDSSGDVEAVLENFVEGAVRDYLYRLVGVDDVGLWLEGWDLSQSDAPAWSPDDPVAERLRLARVLRMLLRERVRVTDRTSIVDVMAESARRGEHRTLPALRDVRLRLSTTDLGVPDGIAVVYVPENLEDRVQAGINSRGTVWDLDRREARRLVLDLRDWLAGLADGTSNLAVRDARLRPFVWRLLGSEAPPVRVFSEEELAHE